MVHSKKFTLHLYDVSKGLFMAVGSGSLGAIIQCTEAGSLPTMLTLKTALTMGIGAGCVYILKNWLTNSEGKIASEPKKEIQ